MKFTEKQLKEMVRRTVRAKLKEAKERDIPDSWAKHMKEVEDLFEETIKKFNDLHEKGEKLKAEEREKGYGESLADRVNNSVVYNFLDERNEALKSIRASLAQKLELWRTRYHK